MKIRLTEGHIYRDETDQVWPGVTSILTDVGLIDSKWFDEYSRDRGSLVHQACALYDHGVLNMDTLDPVLLPYVQGWIRFREESGFIPELIEEVVWNETYRYAGTLDRTGTMNDRAVLIDLKSGLAQTWSHLQTAAYAACLPEPYLRYVVELNSYGNYKLSEHKDRKDFGVFLAALTLRNWKHNTGGLK